jgi:integrase/recombinase XerD
MRGVSVDIAARIDAYLDHLRVERSLAKNTLEAYAHDLNQLASRLGDGARAEDVTEGDLAALLAANARRGFGARSSARQLSAIRGLFKFLVRERVLTVDPTALLDQPRLGRRLPRALSRTEVDGILDMPDEKKPRGARDLAMLHLLYACGLRVSELCALKIADLDRERGVVSVRGKGGKRRLVPVGEVALDLVDAYVAGERARAKKGAMSVTLFLSPSGKTLTRQAMWKIIKRYGCAAGVGAAVSPHKMRHSFATHLLQNGADLRAVQAMLGHADLGTTEIYTRVAQDHVHAAHKRSHPRATRSK